ncbi:MAG: UDP-N-acetylmuramate--L-alanine ligase [Candidatus Brocadiaceae bacterium]|nr:UDP-N-acetylmuramate--L-alanine ligase [Candidatus Brocadiaceae bacterium]
MIQREMSGTETPWTETKQPHSYHFVGVGGIGMSAIAQVLSKQNHIVSGSDNKYDRQITPDLFSKLKAQGISLYPQSGSGVKENTDYLVVSSAIEEDNPDIKKARMLKKTILKRSSLLAGMFNTKDGIAIGGTNGKTTVSCMVGYLLDYAGLSPTIIVGGCIINYTNDSCMGNAKTGTSNIMAIEADESDGSIVSYAPHISVITNISKDHKPIEKISEMFKTFSRNTKETLILNADCPRLKMLNLKARKVVAYGLHNDATIMAKNITREPFRSTFEVNGQHFEVNLPGIHNVSNALAAISVAQCMSIKDETISDALRSFKGVQRRMNIIGDFNGIKVIDDFAHNPEKVKAAINAVRLCSKRVIAVFQPHGFLPARFMKGEFIDSFSSTLSHQDLLFMPEIFSIGDTANKDISSADLVQGIRENGKNAFFIEKRVDIIPEIKKNLQADDCILVMGARDNTLTQFCHEILGAISNSFLLEE